MQVKEKFPTRVQIAQPEKHLRQVMHKYQKMFVSSVLQESTPKQAKEVAAQRVALATTAKLVLGKCPAMRVKHVLLVCIRLLVPLLAVMVQT